MTLGSKFNIPISSGLSPISPNLVWIKTLHTNKWRTPADLVPPKGPSALCDVACWWHHTVAMLPTGGRDRFLVPPKSPSAFCDVACWWHHTVAMLPTGGRDRFWCLQNAHQRFVMLLAGGTIRLRCCLLVAVTVFGASKRPISAL